MSYPDDKLIEEALRHFSNELHEALPLRHFGEFHDQDEDQLKKVIEQRRNSVFKKVFAKIWNREKEEILTLLMKLNGRMRKEVIAEWMKKNSEHRVKFVSFLQKKVEMICDDFNMALEDQLDLNPDMEFESLKNYVMSRKLFAINWFEGTWKPLNVQIQEERKVKLVKHLDALAEEVLEKQKLHFKRKAIKDGHDLLDEVKRIVLEKSRQLKCYLNSHKQRVSNLHLKGKVKDIQEYLLKDKGSALKGSHGEMYSKLLEALENEIKFLSEEAEGNAKSVEELVKWAEGFDAKLRSNFEEWSNQAQGLNTHLETNGADGRAAWVAMQNMLKEDTFILWEPEPEEMKPEERTHPENSGVQTVAVTVETEKVVEVPVRNNNVNEPEPNTASNRMKRHRARPPVSSGNGNTSVRAVASSVVPPKKKCKSDSPKSDGTTRPRSSTRKKTGNSAPSTTTTPRRSNRHANKMAHVPSTNRNGSDEEVIAGAMSPSVESSHAPFNTTTTGERSSHRGRPHRRFRDCEITVLKGDPTTYKCNVCKKTYGCRSYVLKCHGNLCGIQRREKPFICNHNECGKSFFAKTGLEQHLRTHTGEKPFRCPKCPARFSLKFPLDRHLRSHARGSRYTCKTCKLSFVSHNDLHDHYLTQQHSGKSYFACRYCDKQFERMTYLKNHVVVHSDERPFTCTECKSSFCKKKALRSHILRIHSQPNHIASELTNQAAADYLRKEKQIKSDAPVSFDKINLLVVSHVIKKAKLQLPDATNQAEPAA